MRARYNAAELQVLADRARRELSRRCLIDFVQYTNPSYIVNWHHRRYAEKLDAFARGEIKRLMVFMPPQHGKSELCSRRLPAKMLGDDPDRRIALTSYNHDFASKFNRDVQRIIDTEEYRQIYPGTGLNRQNIRTAVGSWLRNADEFEIVGRKGGLVSVGVMGGLTGRTVDCLIIDDPYKDPQDAWSPTRRQNVQDWYDSVADTRLHNESQQLITLTRWHPDDLAGTILKREPELWDVVIFPAIKEGPPNGYDPRRQGEALWPERHSLERLLQKKKNNAHIFQSLYQQNPKPAEGLLFPPDSLLYFRMEEIEELEPDGLVAIADVADTGSDSYCMLVCKVIGKLLYVVDVIFTSAQAEITEPLTLGMLQRWPVQRFRIESNNGGRLYYKSIVEKLEAQDSYCAVEHKVTTANKQTRILTASGQIKAFLRFRSDYEIGSDYERFMDEMTGYSLTGKNEHDDAADGATMLIEMMSEQYSDYSLTY